MDVNAGTVSEATIENSLSGFYRALNCSTIDIVERKVGGVPYDFICDDEALLKPPAKVSAIAKDRSPMLAGNLFLCKSTPDGESTSLSPEDITHIKENILGCISGLEFYGVISNVEYI